MVYYYDILLWYIIMVYYGNIGMMENKVETTRVYRDSKGYIMVMRAWGQRLKLRNAFGKGGSSK